MRVDEIVEEQENEEDDDEAEVLVVFGGQEANYDNEIIVEDNLEE